MALTKPEVERNFAGIVADFSYTERIRMLYFGAPLEEGFGNGVPYDEGAKAASEWVEERAEMAATAPRWHSRVAVGSLCLTGAQYVGMVAASIPFAALLGFKPR